MTHNIADTSEEMKTHTFHDTRLLRGITLRRDLGGASLLFCVPLQAITILLILVAWFALMGSAHASTTVRVVETWPSGDDITLQRNQNFYLRLAYNTDKPVGIWVATYLHNKRVSVGSSPSQTYSGSGETFGWFFFMQPGDEVDEIRVTAGDGSTDNTPVVAAWNGHVVAGSEAATAQDQPAWVVEMSARAKAAQDQDYRDRMSKPVSAGDMALFYGFMLAMLALGLLGVTAPAWAMRHWRGGWRIAAAVPAAMMAFVVLRIVFNATLDPTSHNLWPFEILQVGALSVVVMVVLVVARKLSGAGH
ncbi:MAG: hypothetical protein L0H94_03440 [Nitrospira sp.]|nr:hypothetical protein [Nitrospira sp.]